mgnify:CR=1 FL=1
MPSKKKKAKQQLSLGISQALQNDAKTLFTNIRFSSLDDDIHTILVTSSVPNEGKTTAAINLAAAIASSTQRVCLVETDMRRRSAATALNVHPANGLYAYLSGQVSLQDIITPTMQPSLYFIDCEPSIPNPADILGSKRFAGFVKDLEKEFSYVVFDTPPLGSFVDAAILSTLVDGVLLVIKKDFTKRKAVFTTLDQLNKVNAHVLGTVMTYCDNNESDYYYAYYQQTTDEAGHVKRSRVR